MVSLRPPPPSASAATWPGTFLPRRLDFLALIRLAPSSGTRPPSVPPARASAPSCGEPASSRLYFVSARPPRVAAPSRGRVLAYRLPSAACRHWRRPAPARSAPGARLGLARSRPREERRTRRARRRRRRLPRWVRERTRRRLKPPVDLRQRLRRGLGLSGGRRVATPAATAAPPLLGVHRVDEDDRLRRLCGARTARGPSPSAHRRPSPRSARGTCPGART